MVDEQVIFLALARRQSDLGQGIHHEEHALWWIISEMKIVSFQSAASILTGCVLQKNLHT